MAYENVQTPKRVDLNPSNPAPHANPNTVEMPEGNLKTYNPDVVTLPQGKQLTANTNVVNLPQI